MSDYERRRKRMVQEQLKHRGILDPAVLEAMRTVPRERFVPAAKAESAYADGPVGIGEGQTISQPFIVAAMVEAAQLSASDRVLEVGAGSGYAAAIMGRIAQQVYAIERRAELAKGAQRRFDALGYRNIRLRVSDGTLGWPEEAPFDAILVAASGPNAPSALKQQLRMGGRLVMPVGESEGSQRLIKLTRTGPDAFEQQDLGAVAFVPLIGAQGWSK